MGEKLYDMRLDVNSSMIISGPSKSGKSHFALQMVRQRDVLFKTRINQVFWHYGIASSMHKELRDLNVILKEGIPSQEDIENLQENDMIILDDLQEECKKNKDITEMFLRGAHHRRYFVVQVVQYIFVTLRLLKIVS